MANTPAQAVAAFADAIREAAPGMSQALAQYTYAEGIVSIAGGVCFTLISLALCVFCYPRAEHSTDWSWGVIFSAVGVMGGITIVLTNIPRILEPEGAMYNHLLNRLTGG